MSPWDFIQSCLKPFRRIYTDNRTFFWFVIAVMGLLLRTDTLGVTSIVRAFMLPACTYNCLCNFFHACGDATQTDRLRRISEPQRTWAEVIASKMADHLTRINGRIVFLGDHTKTPKEGHHMPGVKKLTQESQTQSKPDKIHGQMWGSVCVLVGKLAEKLYGIGLSMRIHDGLQATATWKGGEAEQADSAVVRIINDFFRALAAFSDPAYLVLDRAFLTVTVLQALQQQIELTGKVADIITRVKSNCVAYYTEIAQPPRGRKRKRGQAVHPFDLFTKEASEFVKGTAYMYGKQKEIEYYSIELLWGRGEYRRLQFVLVKYGDSRLVLVTTDLTMPPLSVIEAYGARYKIEVMFKTLKMHFGIFTSHFWSTALEKLNHFKKKEDLSNLEKVTDERARANILKTIYATELYATLCMMVCGLVQMIAVLKLFDARKFRYLRTYSNAMPSEETLLIYLRSNFWQIKEPCEATEIRTYIKHAREKSQKGKATDWAA